MPSKRCFYNYYKHIRNHLRQEDAKKDLSLYVLVHYEYIFNLLLHNFKKV